MMLIHTLLVINFMVIVVLILVKVKQKSRKNKLLSTMVDAADINMEFDKIRQNLSENVEVNVSRTSTKDMMKTLLEFYQKKASTIGVDLHIQISSSLTDDHIHECHLIHIVGNLLENAMEAVGGLDEPHVHRISVKLDVEEGNLILQVFNTWPKDLLEGIDTSCWMKSGYSSKAADGRGNGLCIVQKLVRQCDGMMHVDTDDGVAVIVEFTV